MTDRWPSPSRHLLPCIKRRLPEAPYQATVTSIPTPEDCHDVRSTWRLHMRYIWSRSQTSVLPHRSLVAHLRCLRNRYLDAVIAQVDGSRLKDVETVSLADVWRCPNRSSRDLFKRKSICCTLASLDSSASGRTLSDISRHLV